MEVGATVGGQLDDPVALMNRRVVVAAEKYCLNTALLVVPRPWPGHIRAYGPRCHVPPRRAASGMPAVREP